MATIKNAINSYHAETSFYPATLQVLIPTYLGADNSLKDGWRHDFYYEAAALGNNLDQPYVLRSMGSDGIFNTADDLDVWMLDGPMTKMKK